MGLFVVVLVVIFAATIYVFHENVANFFHDGTTVAIQAWKNMLSGLAGDSVVSEISLDDLNSDPAMTLETSTKEISPPSEGVSFPEPILQSSSLPKTKSAVAAKSDRTTSGPSSPPTLSTIRASTMNDAPASSLSAPAASSSKEKFSFRSCAYTGVPPSTPQKIILNEIAWMGSPSLVGESASAASSREWIELKNISSIAVDLFGWQVMNASATLRATLGEHDVVPPGGFYLLARGNASTSVTHADAWYSGGLMNAGDSIFIFDDSCGLSDMLLASNSWPAGDNISKRTLERDGGGLGWHTSVESGGTPGRENSIPASIAFSGSGGDAPSTVLSNASSGAILATSTIVQTSTSDQVANLATSSLFGSGLGTSTVSIASTTQATSTADSAASSTNTGTSTIFAQTSPDHLLIAEVMIGGVSSTNDLIKIFNPSSETVDIQGWKLRKKASTGGDQSIRVFPDGSSIAGESYFIWANSGGGFSESIGADVSSTATLAAGNSVALFDASGTIMDAVAWGSGTDQYVEGSPYPTDPDPGKALARRRASGTFVDTDNNALDFVIQ